MTTVVTPNAPKGWAPDVQALAPESVIPESVLIEATSRVATVEGDEPAVRVPAINLEPDTGFV
ncbi:phage major capsid protein, partial [Mycobacteroides abscessus]|nr:phage major capsid protein [Mycobacteroides abscessus]MDM2578386.1 phage major capsid protein [Mycobacteroides abscessus]MDM2583113.1 phage major capsid protein [Mycobacteroides abscessus]